MAKRLDMILMAHRILEVVDRFKSWLVNVNISSHTPICLKLEVDSFEVKYPFKINHTWNEDDEFASLVKNKWYDLKQNSVDPMKH